MITDLRLLNHTPSISDLSSDGVWVEVSTSLREGVWPRMSPLFLHYRLTSQADIRAARKMDATNGSAGSLEPVTQLDVLYGGAEVNALPGYKKVEGMITGGADDEKRVGSGFPVVKNARVGASLAYRKEKYGTSNCLSSFLTSCLPSLPFTEHSPARQTFLLSPFFDSLPPATSPSYRSPTSTSASALVSAETWTLDTSLSAARSERTSTR